MRERTLLLLCIVFLFALTIPAAAHQAVKDRPKGRNAGWVFSMLYSFDNAVPRDVRHIALATCNRSRSDMIAGTLSYRLNKYFTIGYEESYYRTRAADRIGTLPLYRGIPSYQWHDVRQQLSVFTNF